MDPPASRDFFLEMIPMTIETSFDSNYRKVLVAARRARQIQNGSKALVPTRSNKACRIAQDEINAGKIAYVKTEVEVIKPLVEGPAVPILLSWNLFFVPARVCERGTVLHEVGSSRRAFPRSIDRSLLTPDH